MPVPEKKTPLHRALSRLVGWLADRRIPVFLRKFVYGTFARFTGIDLSETRLALSAFPSLGAFFVRHLKKGARPIDNDPRAIVSPVDGRILSTCTASESRILQIKDVDYSIAELLNSPQADEAWRDATVWTVYLSPKDYHRIHAPEACTLESVDWVNGAFYSVQPDRIRRRKVLSINERVVLHLETERGPLCLVLVGALNVSRMRVVGVEPYGSAPENPPRKFERGEELARFEMGSTIVLLAPKGSALHAEHLESDTPVRLGTPLGQWTEDA